MISRHWFSTLLFILLSLFTLQANMASPYVYGYTPSIGLQSTDIDIEQEDLTITLSDTTTDAYYSVRYHINSGNNKGQLTLIFDPSEPFTGFEVFLDKKPVILTPLQNDSIPADTISYGSDKDDIYYQQFSLNIEQGQHTIDVNYRGYPSEFLGNWVTQYTYTYNLKPAKSWKSFGKLNLTIDASMLNDLVSVDIQDSTYYIQGKSQTWQFDTIPQDVIEIHFLPQGDLPFIVHPEIIFSILFILLLALNIWWIITWRRSHLSLKYTMPAIIGALVVPAISIAIYIYSFSFIDYLIGKYASVFHYYVFLVILLYPIFAILYFIVVWIIDHFYKRKLRSKQKE